MIINRSRTNNKNNLTTAMTISLSGEQKIESLDFRRDKRRMQISSRSIIHEAHESTAAVVDGHGKNLYNHLKLITYYMQSRIEIASAERISGGGGSTETILSKIQHQKAIASHTIYGVVNLVFK